MLTTLCKLAKSLAALTLCAAVAFPVYAQAQQPNQLPPISNTIDQLIVKLKPSANIQTSQLMSAQVNHSKVKLQEVIDRVIAKRTGQQSIRSVKATKDIAQNMSIKNAIDANTIVVSLGGRIPRADADQLIKDIAADKSIEYVEEDALVYPFETTPNATRFSEQWSLHNGPGGAWLTTAWDYTQGSKDVVVAVVDTGYLPHADLNANLLPGYDFLPKGSYNANGGGIGSDGRDFGDGVREDDWTRICIVPAGGTKSSWHGTHVAGIIGAVTNHAPDIARTIAGISWHGKILPVRVLGRCGGPVSSVVTGMRWAAGLSVGNIDGIDVPDNPNPAKVMNLSLGGAGACSPTYSNAIKEIKNKGVSIVVAAGNGNADVSNTKPANCNGVIPVSATDSAGSKATWSNYGAKIKISAPGSSILSLFNTGSYSPAEDSFVKMSGTSMAAPHVSGTIALMLALNPNLTTDQIVKILQESARPFPDKTCTKEKCGAGLLATDLAIIKVKNGDF